MIRIMLLGLAAVIAAGCAPATNRRPVVPVSGALTIGGKPAAGVFVTFVSADPTADVPPRSTAETGPDGTFKLTTYEAFDGATPGEYKVVLLYERPQSPLARAAGPPPKIPGDYLKADTTKLKATVTPSRAGNQITLDVP